MRWSAYGLTFGGTTLLIYQAAQYLAYADAETLRFPLKPSQLLLGEGDGYTLHRLCSAHASLPVNQREDIMATFRVTGGVLTGSVVDTGARPEHPIYDPPQIWPRPPSDAHPEHPIVLPPLPEGPDMIWPIVPGHPIVLPPSPPVGIWPSPGHPAHPIAPGGPPPTAEHPIAPGGERPAHPIAPPEVGIPTHPIYLPPPYPAHPIAPGGERPAHPIAPGGEHPDHSLPGGGGVLVVWVPGVGYIVIPVGPHPAHPIAGGGAGETPDAPQVNPQGRRP